MVRSLILGTRWQETIATSVRFCRNYCLNVAEGFVHVVMYWLTNGILGLGDIHQMSINGHAMPI